MKYHLLRADSDRFSRLIFHDRRDWEVVRRIFSDIDSPSGIQRLPKAQIYHGGKGKVDGDFPSLVEFAPVFSPAAVEKIGDFLSAHGDLFPMPVGDETYFAWRVRAQVSCLDRMRSRLVTLSNGDIVEVEFASFLPGCLTGEDAFRLGEMDLSPIFLSERARTLLERAKLKGLHFVEMGEG